MELPEQPEDPNPLSYLDLGASYWHCCLGDMPDDRRKSRPSNRSVSGLAQLHKPRVAVVSGDFKWEDPVHSKWYSDGSQLSERSVLKTNLFLGWVYDKAIGILQQPERVIKEFIESSRDDDTDDPFLYKRYLTTLDHVLATSENEVIFQCPYHVHLIICSNPGHLFTTASYQ